MSKNNTNKINEKKIYIIFVTFLSLRVVIFVT